MSERVLVTALESRLEELTTLLDAGRAMNAVLELSEVLRRILDNALDLLEADEGSVLLAANSVTGSATDVAPDGFAHPVYRAGFALAIPIPWLAAS